MTRSGGVLKDLKAKANKRNASRNTGVARSTKSTTQEQSLPLEIQQRCLNIFQDAMKTGLEDKKSLQEVKGHLFDRNFAAAFGQEEYLQTYASRWSPSRALGYAEIFAILKPYIFSDETPKDHQSGSLRITCLGGGAGAELVGLAGWCKILGDAFENLTMDLNLIDIAEWTSVVKELTHRIVNPPELSKYASAAAKEANVAFLELTKFKPHFSKEDVLNWSSDATSLATGDTSILTLLFTLNELYSTSMAKTQKLLTQLTASMRSGSLLLVVDSPGSYSTVTINGAEKKYPMQWLLDHTLLGALDRVDVAPWEKLVSDDSRWFRMPEGLQYPIDLENMRYQIHLYRKTEERTAS
ncbi:25S rRNA (uridine(2843)-N(3))-methyltransferase [Acrodontium crateriforme]|uniref:25S rRNA (Uridine(2843)-N(3))-methyltransferase n=1 Tax=Acrodontium crateriforme TaxID=150365 RepID=A0AAQ3M6G1_9PEZI|nr:25S rRNA (uridine(2843)-N(3))-methyltransferase [Acrodontium crateriforme]